jgi:hypothetical protein
MHITIRYEIMPYRSVKQQATLNILTLKSLHATRSHTLTYTYFYESDRICQLVGHGLILLTKMFMVRFSTVSFKSQLHCFQYIITTITAVCLIVMALKCV